MPGLAQKRNHSDRKLTEQLYGTKASTKPQFLLDSTKSLIGTQGEAKKRNDRRSSNPKWEQRDDKETKKKANQE